MKIRWLKTLSFDERLYKEVKTVTNQLNQPKGFMRVSKLNAYNCYDIDINPTNRLLIAIINKEMVILDILNLHERHKNLDKIKAWEQKLKVKEDIEVTIGFTEEPQVIRGVFFADNLVIPINLKDAFQNVLENLSKPTSSEKFFKSTPSLASIPCGSSRLLYTTKGPDYVILDILHSTDKEYVKKTLNWKTRIPAGDYTIGKLQYDTPQKSPGNDDEEDDIGLLFS